MKSATPFLMFQGHAEDAMDFYAVVFPEAKYEVLARFPAEDKLMGGKVMMGRLTLGTQSFMLNDSPPVHQFTFTPSFSIFVECADQAEIDRVFGQLSDGGKVLMELDNHGFSPRFGWVQDTFGVSWQLNCATL